MFAGDSRRNLADRGETRRVHTGSCAGLHVNVARLGRVMCDRVLTLQTRDRIVAT